MKEKEKFEAERSYDSFRGGNSWASIVINLKEEYYLPNFIDKSPGFRLIWTLMWLGKSPGSLASSSHENDEVPSL